LSIHTRELAQRRLGEAEQARRARLARTQTCRRGAAERTSAADALFALAALLELWPTSPAAQRSERGR